MSNNGRNLINDLMKEIIGTGAKDIKNITPEQKQKYDEEIRGLSNIFGIDFGQLIDTFKIDLDEKEKQAEEEELEAISSFDKKYRNKLNIDMDENITDRHGKIEKEPSKLSGVTDNILSKNEDALNALLHKASVNNIRIEDLNKEALEALVNDKRSTDSTIDFVCRACGIDRKVFNYLCVILNVENKKDIVSNPIKIKYLTKNNELVYYCEWFNIIINKDFKALKIKNKTIIEIITNFTKLLEEQCVYDVTSDTQTVIPFIEYDESDPHYQCTDDVYGYAIFNIPLNSFAANIDKITVDCNNRHVPILIIRK